MALNFLNFNERKTDFMEFGRSGPCSFQPVYLLSPPCRISHVSVTLKRWCSALKCSFCDAPRTFSNNPCHQKQKLSQRLKATLQSKSNCTNTQTLFWMWLAAYVIHNEIHPYSVGGQHNEDDRLAACLIMTTLITPLLLLYESKKRHLVKEIEHVAAFIMFY